MYPANNQPLTSSQPKDAMYTLWCLVLHQEEPFSITASADLTLDKLKHDIHPLGVTFKAYGPIDLVLWKVDVDLEQNIGNLAKLEINSSSEKMIVWRKLSHYWTHAPKSAHLHILVQLPEASATVPIRLTIPTAPSAKTAHLFPIHITVSKRHKDSISAFFSAWEKWIQGLQGYTIKVSFVQVPSGRLSLAGNSTTRSKRSHPNEDANGANEVQEGAGSKRARLERR